MTDSENKANEDNTGGDGIPTAGYGLSLIHI